MSELRNILSDSVNGLLARRVSREMLIAFDGGAGDGGLWAEIEAQGLARPLVSEANGGAGGAWRDAHVLLFAQGYHAAPAPLGETILATWLAEKAGLTLPGGAVTVIDGRAGLCVAEGLVSGGAARTPWAAHCEHALLVARGETGVSLGLLNLADADITPGANLAREPRDDVRLDGAPVILKPLPDGMAAEDVMRLGAMLRAAQIAGALERALEMAVQYANERTQFGRPIGRFQAIQQELARAAGETAAAAVIAEAPFAALDEGRPSAQLIAAAKARCSEAAGLVASVAHQTHGAIGFTHEHSLHFFTRRLWSWRSEFGNQRHWQRRLGAAVVARGPAHFWADITA